MSTEIKYAAQRARFMSSKTKLIWVLVVVVLLILSSVMCGVALVDENKTIEQAIGVGFGWFGISAFVLGVAGIILIAWLIKDNADCLEKEKVRSAEGIKNAKADRAMSQLAKAEQNSVNAKNDLNILNNVEQPPKGSAEI